MDFLFLNNAFDLLHILWPKSMSPEASEFPLGYSTRLSIKRSDLIRQFPLAARTQSIICKPTRKGSWAVNTCGQDQLVLFHGQATEARVSGARVLVTWDKEDREGGGEISSAVQSET